jgi:uncharacterized protein YdeI (YjbR/CyaY-like superfamily)
MELAYQTTAMPTVRPTFFATQAAWRAWLARHHATRQELWVGFYKKASGKPSITWPQSVDEALCFGWIDGIRKSVDDERYMIRFTPRRPGSGWSVVNTKRAAELIALGLMHQSGLEAFARRSEARTRSYSYEERKHVRLPRDFERRFRARRKAWEYFSDQPPGYRRTAIFWVVSAKREETRLRRLKALIADSASGRWIGPLRRR